MSNHVGDYFDTDVTSRSNDQLGSLVRLRLAEGYPSVQLFKVHKNGHLRTIMRTWQSSSTCTTSAPIDDAAITLAPSRYWKLASVAEIPPLIWLNPTVLVVSVELSTELVMTQCLLGMMRMPAPSVLAGRISVGAAKFKL